MIGLKERIEKYYIPEPNTGCWLWIGAMAGVKTHLYGALKVKGKMIRAHRLSYELTNGKIPEGLVIDHKCKNTLCVNPSHLRAVTQRINSIENSLGVTALNNQKTQCVNGHEFNDRNSRVIFRDGKPRRECVKCRSIYSLKKTNSRKIIKLKQRIEALKAADAKALERIERLEKDLELAIEGLKDVSDWCEYHSGPTADKYLEALSSKSCLHLAVDGDICCKCGLRVERVGEKYVISKDQND